MSFEQPERLFNIQPEAEWYEELGSTRPGPDAWKPFHDDMPLREVRALVLERVVVGLSCPACGQRAKVYQRRIHSTLARTAITIYRAGGTSEFVHPASLDGDTHEASQLSWWSLLEEELVRRPDGGRAGWWRMTSVGASFVLGMTAIPKYALIYDASVQGFAGPLVTIRDCLGEKFDYRELMEPSELTHA